MDNADPGYHVEVDAFGISGGSYAWASFFSGGVGPVTTDGTAIAFHEVQRCFLGTPGELTGEQIDYTFTATDDRIDLFQLTSAGPIDYYVQHVYLRVSEPNEVCDTVDVEPEQPGDSPQCTMRTCACVFRVDGTIDENECSA